MKNDYFFRMDYPIDVKVIGIENKDLVESEKKEKYREIYFG